MTIVWGDRRGNCRAVLLCQYTIIRTVRSRGTKGAGGGGAPRLILPSLVPQDILTLFVFHGLPYMSQINEIPLNFTVTFSLGRGR